MRGFVRSLRALVVCLGILCAVSSANAELRMGRIEAVLLDNLAVVHTELIDPFSEETQQTLLSGLPVAIDLEIHFIRTGYVKRVFNRVVVQYDVWTEQYRVITPLAPISVGDFETLLSLLRNDLAVTLDYSELPGEGPWLVKARAGERRVLRDEDLHPDAVTRIEEELSGVSRWLFRRGRPQESFCDWSELTQLHEPHEAGR